MNIILIVGEIVVATILVVAILFQRQGGGLSSTLGGGGEVYRTKRGAEKFLIQLTIALAIILFILAVIRIAI